MDFGCILCGKIYCDYFVILRWSSECRLRWQWFGVRPGCLQFSMTSPRPRSLNESYRSSDGANGGPCQVGPMRMSKRSPNNRIGADKTREFQRKKLMNRPNIDWANVAENLKNYFYFLALGVCVLRDTNGDVGWLWRAVEWSVWSGQLWWLWKMWKYWKIVRQDTC